MFELASPWFLILLPLPILWWFIVPEAPIRCHDAVRVPFFTAIKGFISLEQRTLAAQSSLTIPTVIWLLLIIAFAGPRWIGEPLPVEREGYNIMLALDLSGSMDMTDMILHGRPVSRLAVVKQAAAQFVKDRKADRIGLILFGAQAYLQTPLTYDRQSILMRIEDATVGLAGKTTSIGDAVGLAVKRLEEVPKQGRVIILLTDGANNSGVLSPLKAAEIAKEDDIKMYTIGLGADSDPRAMGPGALFDFNVSADLDEETLQEMAKMTGGHYFRATDPESLHRIYQTINKLERINQEQASIRPQKEYYPWLVACALLLCFFWLAQQKGVFYRLSQWREGLK